MTTYTVYHGVSGQTARGLSVTDAMAEALSLADWDYEIREDAGTWELWLRRISRTTSGDPLRRSEIYSLADDEATAKREIAEHVFTSQRLGDVSVRTDAEHDAMLAEIAAEEG